MTVNLTQQISEKRLAAKEALRKKDLHLPLRPRYDVPRLPLGLTDLPDDELMKLLVKFTRYQNYVAGQLVEAEIDESSIESLLDLAKANRLVNSWSKSTDSVNVAKAEALTDREVVRLSDRLQQCKANRRVLSVLAESLSREGSAASRELSRRIGREPSERRSGHRFRD